MSKDSVNTGGAEQVYIEELMDLRRDYAKADEEIEELKAVGVALQRHIADLECLVHAIYDTGQIRELPSKVVMTWDLCVSAHALKHKKLNGV